MYEKRSLLLMTEFLLLFLVSQLFWPLQEYADMSFVWQSITYVQLLVSCVVLLVLPGWWWSFVFFADDQIGSIERGGVSFAISLALLVFTSAYLQVGGVILYPSTVLVVVTIWLFLGILIDLLWTRKRSENDLVAELTNDVEVF